MLFMSFALGLAGLSWQGRRRLDRFVLSGWQEKSSQGPELPISRPMSRSITIIAVTGLFGTIGLTFAMSQALTMQPEHLGEGEVKEHFRIRFRPHSESEPRLQIQEGSVPGKIRVQAWMEPKITEDRQRLGFLLRDFLWGAEYKSGRPETVHVVYRDPVTRKTQEKQLYQLQRRRLPHLGPKKAKVTTKDGKTPEKGTATIPESTRPSSQDAGTQSSPKDLKGKGFKSQSSSSKTR